MLRQPVHVALAGALRSANQQSPVATIPQAAREGNRLDGRTSDVEPRNELRFVGRSRWVRRGKRTGLKAHILWFVTYGQYISRTGATLAAWEAAFGRYWYESRFAGRERILDIGPGRCWFLRQAPDRISGSRARAREASWSAPRPRACRVAQGDVNAMPFPAGSFERRVCCWLFEHLADPITGAKEIARVLTPGAAAV